MKNIFIALILLVCSIGLSKELTPGEQNKIADAIKIVENSPKYPYGIRSIPIIGNTQLEKEQYARKICLNTIRHKFSDWNKAGAKDDFIEYLGSKYCPISDKNDKNHLNQNWVKNMKKILNKN